MITIGDAVALDEAGRAVLRYRRMMVGGNDIIGREPARVACTA